MTLNLQNLLKIFLPLDQERVFPTLADLAYDYAFSNDSGLNMEEERLMAFQGFNRVFSLAYFGQKI